MSVFTFRRWQVVGLVLTAAISFASVLKAQESAAVASTLDNTTELDFIDQPLADVVEYLKAKHDIEIQFDEKALAELGIETHVAVTQRCRGITLAAALKHVLAEFGLGYVVADNVVLITSQWKARKSARHSSIAAQHQRRAEAKIEAALDQKTEFDFTDQPLSDVIEYLKATHDIEIQFDNKSLADSGVGRDTTVTRSLKGISLHSALSLILGEIDLDYAIRDEVLLITTRSAMRTMRGLRVYPIYDLVMTGEETDEGLKEDSHPNYQPLITAVRSALGKDAEAEVYAYPLTGSLIVSASFAGQRQVEKLLDLLRQVREQQGPIEHSRSE